MTSRADALRDLIRFCVPLDRARAQLAQYEWDSREAVVTLNATDVAEVLKRFAKGEISANEIEDWANAVEMREDIESADELVKDAIFDLANPVLQGPLTVEDAGRWIERLGDK